MPTSSVAERLLRRWAQDAGELEKRTAQVLATTLAVPRRTLLSTVQNVDQGATPADLIAAARDLLDRPFVERVAEGYRISEPVATLLRQQFQSDDEGAFAAVNSELVATERVNLQAADNEEERWFIRGRIAFYLAASDPSESAQEFIQTFAEPPTGDAGPQRLWLTDLALRQQALLATETRALDFFQGFREYKRGNFGSARRSLARVISTDEHDQYRAIALHLWSVLADLDPLSEARLREAIDLSRTLGLVENEIMARNTLVFRLVARASRFKSRAVVALQEAGGLAERNLSLAERTGDRYLIVGSRYGMVQSQWLNFSDGGSKAQQVPDTVVSHLLRNLDLVIAEATATGDFETAAGAINLSASMARDRGLYRDAVEVISRAYGDWQKYSAPRAARRWAQTAGSMLQAEIGPDTRSEIHDLLASLNAWLDEDRPDR